MNKKVILVGLAAVISSFLAFQSVSTQDSLDTAEKCTSLLPSDYKFSMTIEADIDTANAQPSMTGELHLTDGTKAQNPDLSAKVAPFKQCVVRVMK